MSCVRYSMIVVEGKDAVQALDHTEGTQVAVVTTLQVI